MKIFNSSVAIKPEISKFISTEELDLFLLTLNKFSMDKTHILSTLSSIIFLHEIDFEEHPSPTKLNVYLWKVKKNSLT